MNPQKLSVDLHINILCKGTDQWNILHYIKEKDRSTVASKIGWSSEPSEIFLLAI